MHTKKLKNKVLSLLVFLFFSLSNNCFASSGNDHQTDLIIYSYDRPMQLYALLESVHYYISGLDTIFVIYRTSSSEFEEAYGIVKKNFENVQFISQKSPYSDLKELTCQCIVHSSNNYILFGVDDIIIKDSIDLCECIQVMEQQNAYGFFFRLGRNLNYCYAMHSAQPLPPLTSITHQIYSWQFNQGIYDWNYPNNLDFTLYRKPYMETLLATLDYTTPYSLESKLMSQTDYTLHGLCYESSRIVNFPLNVVQSDWPNNHDNNYSTLELLELFNQGLKIDLKPIAHLDNKSAHISGKSLISFIARHKIDEKLIVIVTPSYNNKGWWLWNLTSLVNQDYRNYYIIITDDCSTDGTGQAIKNYIKENDLEDKVIFTQNNERRGALHNLYTMIHSCSNQAIILTVDGDDALPDKNVLKKINQIYSTQDVWLTYGQFVEHPSGTKGWCTPMPTHVINNNAFRYYQDLPSHLRTFYAWLFKSIKLEDMLYYGDFYRMSWDFVMMLPMIEMAGKHHACIEDQILYIYNNANTISDHKISRQLQAHLSQTVRAKKQYSPLPAPLEDFAQNLSDQKADMIIFAEDCNPALLDQCITSIQQNITGIGEICVLYLAWPTTQQKYIELQEKYNSVIFLEIEENRTNFKDLLCQLYTNMLENHYVVFALPTTTVKKPINLNQCICALEEVQAYGFSLKLSKETPPRALRMPLLEIKEDICAWNYATATDSWSCANNVDMTLYRRHNPTVEYILKNNWMYSWIHFVGWWAHEGNLDKMGLCFKNQRIADIS